MPLTKLQFRPGIVRDLTSYSNEGGWRDGDKVRFRLGYPEKMGGWGKYTSSTFLGSCRALHNWVALDGSNYLGVATHLKYYIEEGGSFSDITPIRSTSSQGEVTFSATPGSGTITVTHNNHGADQNDFVVFSGAEGLGGNVTAALLNTEHQITRLLSASIYEIFIEDFVQTFSSVVQTSTSGTGTGAVFTITTDGNGGYSVAAIITSGTGYAASDTITVDGTALGGATPANDLTITISSVTGGGITAVTSAGTSRTATSADTGVGGAGVGTVTLSGTGVGGTGVKTASVGTSGTGVGAATFSSPSSDGVGNLTISGASTGSATTTGVVQTSTNGSGTGATFSVTASSGVYTVVVTAVGSGYVVGEEILIEGQNLGGTKGTNDLTLTITGLAGSSVGSTTHTGVVQTSTSGIGTGAEFSVTTDGSGGYSISVTTVGSGYAVNDTITIAGTSLGGATPANDLILTVTQLSGSSIGADTFTGVAQTSTSGSGTGVEFTVTTDGKGGYTVDAVETIGSNYAVNDTITIAGTSLGGATPANDLVLTVTVLTSVTYTNVVQTSTSGTGTGAQFTITTDGTGVYTVGEISDIGTGYVVNDTITIAGTSLGGATPANDLVLTVSALSFPTIANYQINVGLNSTVGGTGYGAGPFSGAAGHIPVSTTLNGATTTTATTLRLNSTAGLPTSGYVVVIVPSGVSEVVQYTGISGNDLTGCNRGMFNSPAAAHSSGATVQEATYGFGIPSSLTTTTQIRLWSHDNFGEDLLINARDAAIYYWNKSAGTGTRAVELRSVSGTKRSVPTICKQVMVSDRDRHILAFGCDAVGADSAATQGNGVQDPLLIRFSSQENAVDWWPTATNTAGDLRLGSGSTFVRALETKREILIWTDTALTSMRFIGPPFTFGLQQLASNITITGPNAAVATEDFVFWMGIDNFYVYAGQTTQLPCTVKESVFNDINVEQGDKIYSGVNAEFSEVFWFYPSADAVENNRYVVYNYLEKLWYYGTMERTAWLDRGTRIYPIATDNNGYVYNHEFGYDADGAPMDSYIESSVMDIGDGDHYTYIRRVIPDMSFSGSTAISTPQATFTIKARDFPGEDFGNTGSAVATRTQVSPVQEYTNQLYVRARGRSFALRVESNSLGSKWRLGSPRVDMRPDGRR